MVLYLQLDQEYWYKGDYSDVDALAITGTIYSNATMLTAFNLTGYTLKIKGFNQRGEQEISAKDATIVSAVAGTFKYLPEIGDLNFEFIGDLELELTKAGTVISAKGRNGSGSFFITE
jgi:hypothetical protein